MVDRTYSFVFFIYLLFLLTVGLVDATRCNDWRLGGRRVRVNYVDIPVGKHRSVLIREGETLDKPVHMKRNPTAADARGAAR